MKIGFEAISIFGASGIEMYTRSIIRAFSELEEHPELVLFSSGSRKTKVEEYFKGLPGISVKNQFTHPLALGSAGAPLIKFIKNKFLLKSAASQVDLLHNVNPCYFPKNIKNMAVTVHDLFVFYEEDWAKAAFEPNQKEFQKNFLASFKNAKVIFVPTNYVKNELLERFPLIEPQKVFVTYEAATAKFTKVQPDFDVLKKNGINPETKYFLFVSRFDPRKNYERTLEAFSLLPAELKNEYKFVFVGGAKDYITKKVYELVRKLGISGNFIHLDNIIDDVLVQVYNRATALVFASYAEGFGLPLVEAMNCGCPVITSNVSCMPEIGGDAAFYVNPLNVEEIRDAMLKLALNDNFGQFLFEKSYERAKLYSWNKTALQTYEGYKWALEK